MREDGLFKRPLAWLKTKSPEVHRFLVRRDKPYPWIREGIGVLLIGIIVVSALWGGTGQTFPTESPVVVIESGSMMHCDEGPGPGACTGPFGRLGTIDPGDLVFVKDVDGKKDVKTFCAATKIGCTGAAGSLPADYLQQSCSHDSHGACGDVIVFIPNGDTSRTPVIHRAILWLEVHGDGTFSIPECGIDKKPRSELSNTCLGRLNARSLRDNAVLDTLGPEDSGFITRGDNNIPIDQRQNDIAEYPVRPDWVIGKARGEVAWIGLVKLFVSDIFVGTDNFANAPGDTKVMMGISLGALVGAPFLFELVVKRVKRDDADDQE